MAPLGVASFRVVLECKTASPGGMVSNPRPEKAAKFRDGAHATKSVLLGPAFGGDASLDAELGVHQVALWTVDDRISMLEAQIGLDETRPLLEAGRVEPALRALLWERHHGRRKRVAVIADQMARALWQTQVTLATTVPFEQMPVIGEDTLFILVDQTLVAEGLNDGARLDEAHAAIALLLDTGALRREEVRLRRLPTSDWFDDNRETVTRSLCRIDGAYGEAAPA